ncbi:MAG: hypothetical protein H0T62_10030 [Parachlamydiaceae bacterium]|nr:hypothetical protein [Parachlamydiaceae bacterium]
MLHSPMPGLADNFAAADESSVSSSISDPQQYKNQIKILSELATNQEESDVYYHRIQNVDIEKKILILNDQSKWDVSSMYEDVIINWQIGDRISLIFNASQSGFGIHNLDKESFAWGIWDFKTSSLENSDSIVEVSYVGSPKYTIKITLKSGFQFGIPPQIISKFNINFQRVIQFIFFLMGAKT